MSIGEARVRALRNIWTMGTGTLKRPRFDPMTALLADGRALVAGGETLLTQHADGEIYDPKTTDFVRFVGMSDERAFGHTASLLDNGRVLVMGSAEEMRASRRFMRLAGYRPMGPGRAGTNSDAR